MACQPSHPETSRVDASRRRCPPVKQRAPFVRGCVPERTGPSHDTGRVTNHRVAAPKPRQATVTGGYLFHRRRRRPSAFPSCSTPGNPGVFICPFLREDRVWRCACCFGLCRRAVRRLASSPRVMRLPRSLSVRPTRPHRRTPCLRRPGRQPLIHPLGFNPWPGIGLVHSLQEKRS